MRWWKRTTEAVQPDNEAAAPPYHFQQTGDGHHIDMAADLACQEVSIQVAGQGHRLVVERGCRLERVHIRFGEGSRKSVCVIKAGTTLINTEITLDGAGGHAMHLGEGVTFGNERIGSAMRAEDEGCQLHIGDGTVVVGAGISVTEGGSITMGRHCLLAYDIDIRNGDSHGIWDQATGERLNPAQDVVLEDRIWLAYHVQVLKGVTIGHDSVIASNACVTTPIPAHSLAAGIPAKVVRSGIVWTMSRDSPPQQHTATVTEV